MRNRGKLIASVLIVAVGFISSCQSSSSRAEKTTATPDLSGVWDVGVPAGAHHAPYSFSEDEPPMTPWAEARYKAAKTLTGPRGTHADANDPIVLTVTGKPADQIGCFPAGLPRIYLERHPTEIIQFPGRVVMLFEFDHLFREIYTDGRGHSTNVGPTWMGDSIGKWEGDTLVVDTNGFNDKTWLDWVGHPHSDQLHLVERIRRVDQNTLRDDMTFDDPKAYTRPWQGSAIFQLHPEWAVQENVCEDSFFYRMSPNGDSYK